LIKSQCHFIVTKTSHLFIITGLPLPPICLALNQGKTFPQAIEIKNFSGNFEYQVVILHKALSD